MGPNEIAANLGWNNGQRIREYGAEGPIVIHLHGGPGAYGGEGPIARELSDTFRVLAPWQRGGSQDPLSVVRHVEDLKALIDVRCGGESPVLLGESWGAFLALAYAAKYPDSSGPLALIGCGTFDHEARSVLVNTRRQRIVEYVQQHPEHSADLELDLGEQIMKWHGITDSFEPIVTAQGTDVSAFDAQAHKETFDDWLACLEKGVYPQAFAKIKSPVLMLHGDYDPHPGKMIRDSLLPHIPQLEYHEFENCGHDPALEKHARDEFLRVLKEWLVRKARN